MKLFLFINFFIGFLFCSDSFSDRKVISDDNFNYTFHTTNKEISKFNLRKEYYWYKSGKIHSSFGNVAGHILDGNFKKTFKNNEIAEQGNFHKGLKDKAWISWYKNGKIKEIKNWNKGFLSGSYKKFDSNGNFLLLGKYVNNKKNGRWINFSNNDTLFYKNGRNIIKDVSQSQPTSDSIHVFHKLNSFFKKTFHKKSSEKDSLFINRKERSKKRIEKRDSTR